MPDFKLFIKRDPKNPFILKFDDKGFKKKYPNYEGSRMPSSRELLQKLKKKYPNSKASAMPMPTLKQFKNKYDKFNSKKKKK